MSLRVHKRHGSGLGKEQTPGGGKPLEYGRQIWQRGGEDVGGLGVDVEKHRLEPVLSLRRRERIAADGEGRGRVCRPACLEAGHGGEERLDLGRLPDRLGLGHERVDLDGRRLEAAPEPLALGRRRLRRRRGGPLVVAGGEGGDGGRHGLPDCRAGSVARRLLGERRRAAPAIDELELDAGRRVLVHVGAVRPHAAGRPEGARAVRALDQLVFVLDLHVRGEVARLREGQVAHRALVRRFKTVLKPAVHEEGELVAVALGARGARPLGRVVVGAVSDGEGGHDWQRQAEGR
mmetsp:Transcript_12256/g.35394  ORF Transcript_12256/g.35394 Transcript_12256/m.35394 type:complete len:291 (+) Transcript_12256:119-991(+)